MHLKSERGSDFCLLYTSDAADESSRVDLFSFNVPGQLIGNILFLEGRQSAAMMVRNCQTCGLRGQESEDGSVRTEAWLGIQGEGTACTS